MLVLKYKDPSILLFLTPAYPTAVFSGLNIVALRSVILKKKKKKNGGQLDHFGLKMGHRHNFGSAVRVFCKFCTIKRANRQMKVIIMICAKKNCSGQMGRFVPRNGPCDNSGSALTILLNFCRVEQANRYM